MATASNSYEGKNPDWKKQSTIGSLPDDFLCVAPTPEQQQEANDHMAAVALQRRANARYASAVSGGCLTIGVICARLTKNYGMTRMDPYVRLRIGHSVFETHTDISGSKTPRWEKTIQCLLPPGIDMMHVEIFDECSFTADELIAWTYIPIPRAVLAEGKTVDEWFALSGKQGEDQEGHINLVLSYSAMPPPAAGVPAQTMYPYRVAPQPFVVPGAYVAAPAPVAPVTPFAAVPVAPVGQPVPVAQQAVPCPAPVLAPPRPPVLSEEDLKEFQDMFPAVEETVIRTAFESSLGDKNRAVAVLLELSS